MIEDVIDYNRKFVAEKNYEPYETSKYPDKKLAILTCMDTRLTELLPAALGIHNGDAKIIKNAGGVISHPYGSAEEIMVIGHTDCGVQGMDGKKMVEKLKARGIPEEHIDIIRKSGINLEQWLGGFESAKEAVKESVDSLKNHPLMPKDLVIRGFMMDSVTGELTALC